MYARGVRCSDCHEPHSMQLRAEGNAVCTQCHSPAGNDRFPTLRKALYDDPSHHFHAAGTPGAECKSTATCREQTYMGIDRRRDHGFRVPRPDLDAETGAPDACTACHADRDPAWAAAELARALPGEHAPRRALRHRPRRRPPRPGGPRRRAGGARRPADLAGIVRATALDLLVPVADPSIADRAAPLLADPDPLVRAAAAALQRGVPDGAARLERLAPTLADPLRSVRIAGAKAMLGADPAAAPAAQRAALADASAEWQRALASQIDFPETNMQIGGAALASRSLDVADSAFGEAVALDPQLVHAWAMLARIRAATGDTAGARAALDAGLAANPGQPDLAALRSQLGP